jgi:hypothetical protein
MERFGPKLESKQPINSEDGALNVVVKMDSQAMYTKQKVCMKRQKYGKSRT